MAREIASVKIEEEVSGGGVIVVIIVIAGRAAKDDGGGREATIDEAGVDPWEARICRQLAEVGVRGDGGARGGYAIPRLLQGGDVTPVPALSKLHPAQRRDPRAHVVPHGRPAAVVGSVVMCGSKAAAVLERHDAVAAKAAGKLG